MSSGAISISERSFCARSARARLALSGRPSAASIGPSAAGAGPAVASVIAPPSSGRTGADEAPVVYGLARHCVSQAWNLASTSSWLSAHHSMLLTR